MFEFFKDYDENIYDEIIKEVESNLSISSGYVLIISAIEKIVKPICIKHYKEPFIITSKKVSLGMILHNASAREYLIEKNILTRSEVGIILDVNKISNARKHDNEKIDEASIRKYYKLLYDVCVRAYKLKFGFLPDSHWDEEYFKKAYKNQREFLIEENSQLKDKKSELETKNKELAKDNEKLKAELGRLSIPISRLNVPEYANSQLKNYEYKPNFKLKKIDERKEVPTAQNVVSNKINLKKISFDHNVNLSYAQNLGIVFDYINRGWFDEARKELSSMTKTGGDAEYAMLLCQTRRKTIAEVSDNELLEDLNLTERLISSCTPSTAKAITEKLKKMFEKGSLIVKSQIFQVLAGYDFDGRKEIVEEYDETLKKAIQKKEVDDSQLTGMVLFFVSTFEKEYFDKIKEFMQESLDNNNFLLANELNKLIFRFNDKDIYALTKQILIDCQVKDENSLKQNIGKLENVSIFQNLLEELSTQNKAMFLFYVDMIVSYLKDVDAQNMNVQKTFQLFLSIYEYAIPDREEVKNIMGKKLLDCLGKSNSKEAFDCLETILKWSKNGKEYVDLCQQMAIASLDSPVRDDRFVNILTKINPDNFLTIKIGFYYNQGLSFKKAKPFKSFGTVEKGFENLVKLSTTKERKELIKEMVKSLIASLDMTPAKENYALFNIFIKYFISRGSAELYAIMKEYADALVEHSCFETAKLVLRQTLSLNYKNYEVCFSLLLCDLRAKNETDLVSKEDPLIDNEFFNMAVKLAYVSDKDAYNRYLDLYSKQVDFKKAEIEKEKREEEQRTTRNQALKLCVSNCFLGLFPFAIAFIMLYIGIVRDYEGLLGMGAISILPSLVMSGGRIISSIGDYNRGNKKGPPITEARFWSGILLGCVSVAAVVLAIVFI